MEMKRMVQQDSDRGGYVCGETGSQGQKVKQNGMGIGYGMMMVVAWRSQGHRRVGGARGFGETAQVVRDWGETQSLLLQSPLSYLGTLDRAASAGAHQHGS